MGKIAEIVAGGCDAKQSIARTQLSNGYVISTIERLDTLKTIDETISMLMGVTGTTYSDLADHTEAGFRVDLSAEGDYETMVFVCDDKGEITNWEERAFVRYMSREEAEEGHKEMVEKWRRL